MCAGACVFACMCSLRIVTPDKILSFLYKYFNYCICCTLNWKTGNICLNCRCRTIGIATHSDVTTCWPRPFDWTSNAHWSWCPKPSTGMPSQDPTRCSASRWCWKTTRWARCGGTESCLSWVDVQCSLLVGGEVQNYRWQCQAWHLPTFLFWLQSSITKQLNQKQINILHLIFRKKGAHPPNSYVVFCHKK